MKTLWALVAVIGIAVAVGLMLSCSCSGCRPQTQGPTWHVEITEPTPATRGEREHVWRTVADEDAIAEPVRDDRSVRWVSANGQHREEWIGDGRTLVIAEPIPFGPQEAGSDA
jgi:hypothetical protein